MALFLNINIVCLFVEIVLVCIHKVIDFVGFSSFLLMDGYWVAGYC